MMQMTKQVEKPVKYVKFEKPPSEKKLKLRQYSANTLTAALMLASVLWALMGAFQLAGVLRFFPSTIVSWALYFLVGVIVGVGIWLAVTYANEQVKTRYFFYEEVQEGTIIGHTFMDVGKRTCIVRVIFKGKSRAGQIRDDTVDVDAKIWRKGGYGFGQKLSFQQSSTE